ncbi:MAG TPA: IPT/TIG domain-containing protein, partial [Acidobacteriaceae bacterium]|nr:IPT/TIG domain-containing protein [Acidobacteriaceae bacterium]
MSGCSGSGSAAGAGGSQTPGVNAVPNVASVSPTSVTAGAGAQTITVTGSGFVQGSAVSFNGSVVPTTYGSATTLQAQVPASALTAGGVAAVLVTNPTPGGGSSATVSFSVMSPTPKVSDISPKSVAQARQATITITGTGFESNSAVTWNGVAVPTTFVNGTTLQVSLTADQVQSLGNAQVTVNNPGPGGSATVPVAVLVYPVPTVTAVSPASAAVGSGAKLVTVTGTNFIAGSVVQLDATAYPTASASATSLTAQIPAAAFASGRTANLTVQNPDPLPAVSLSFPFPVTAPTPLLGSISPTIGVQGSTSATITLTGTGFEANSAMQWNGSARPTTFVNPTSLRATLTAADLASVGTGQITVNNPGPGGSTSGAQTLTVVAPPVITAVSPTTITQPTSQGTTVTLTVTGTNFGTDAFAQVNGIRLPTTSETSTQIVATISYNQLYQTGAAKITVANLAAPNTYVQSQPATVNVINPTAPFSLSPSSAAVGSPDVKATVYGGGFFADSVVQWNGTPLATTYSSSTSMSVTIPAALLSSPGSARITIATPENLGAASATQGFSTYIAMPMNGLVWNSKDGLLYATIPGRAGPGLGNSLVGIDPVTGAIQRTIFVGSEPNRLAISDDGTQAFVGLDGPGAVRQVNLQTGTAGVQWSLGGYNPPYTASALAVLPGQANSVAVYGTNGVVTIYDSGVARAKSSSGLNTYFSSNRGVLAFGSSASTLYLAAQTTGNYGYALTVDSTGISAVKSLSTSGSGSVQYDNGRLYFSNGVVADATTGTTLGQFSITNSYSSTPVAASGPMVSESGLNRAWVLVSNFMDTPQLMQYDETTFNPLTSLAVTGLGAVNSNLYQSGTPADLVRWGQNGLAFHTSDQLYLLHGSIVKDTSGSPADLQVTAQVPATVSTGTAIALQLQVKNLGTSDAQGVMLSTRLPGTLIYGSASASQGSCSGNGVLYCDLGGINNGASATVTISATPSTAGTIEVDATIDSQSFDPNAANNQVAATTTSSGALFSPVPVVSSVSPRAVQAG